MALGWSEGTYGDGAWGLGGEGQIVSVTGVSATVNTARTDTFTAFNDAKLSTAQFKFGDASAVFDGLADYIRPDSNTAWGAGDFTLEFWFYYSSIGASNYFLFDNRIASTNGLLIYISTDNKVNLVVNGGGGGVAISPTLTTGIWNSVAVERSGTAMSFYVNGTKTGSLSANSTDYSGRKYSIGASSYITPGSFGFNGYIDEFRTSTTARYSGASYTPATAEFSPDVFTTDLLHFDGANGSTLITNSATSGVIGVVGEATVSPTGVAASGELGQENISGAAQVLLVGVSGAGEISTASVSAKAIFNVTGVSGTGELGTASVGIFVSVSVTGVAGTGELGEEDVSGKANVTVTGASASGLLGTLTMSGKAIVDVTGVVGAVGLGSVTTRTVNNFAVTGVQADTALGEVEVQGEAVVILVTGVSATGQVSRPLVWGLINTNQSANWLPIAA